MRLERLPFSPQLVHACWTLRRLPSELAPSWAQSALELGYDGRNVRRLAGLMRPTLAELFPLMPGFLEELGIHKSLTEEDAAWLLVRLVARGISDQRITPYEGARFIGYEIVNGLWPNQQHPLLIFVALASDYEDCETYTDRPKKRRQEIEQEIIKAANSLATPAE